LALADQTTKRTVAQEARAQRVKRCILPKRCLIVFIAESSSVQHLRDVINGVLPSPDLHRAFIQVHPQSHSVVLCIIFTRTYKNLRPTYPSIILRHHMRSPISATHIDGHGTEEKHQHDARPSDTPHRPALTTATHASLNPVRENRVAQREQQDQRLVDVRARTSAPLSRKRLGRRREG
jgi:hypothetical protein